MTFAQSSKQVFPNGNATLPFSTAVKADGLIYVLGHAGRRGGDIKAQTKQTLDNISATLKTAGSSLANAASVMVYLAEPERLRGDERGLSHLLDQGSAGAHDRRRAQPLAEPTG